MKIFFNLFLIYAKIWLVLSFALPFFLLFKKRVNLIFPKQTTRILIISWIILGYLVFVPIFVAIIRFIAF